MSKEKNPISLLELQKVLKEQKVPEYEQGDIIFRYLDRKARIKGVPLHGIFEITPLCNLDCKMCYVHLNSHQFHQEQLLSVDVWKDLINQAHAAGMMRASITGGECLTHPGFDEIYLHIISLGIRPTVLSNGVLLDEKRIKFFKLHQPRRIQVTLYGGSDDTYEKVTGHRVFGIVFKNLMMVRDAGLPLSISITPNAYMKKDMRSLLEAADSLKVPYTINSSLKPPRKNTDRIAEDMTVDEYIELYKIQHEISGIPLGEPDDSELPDRNHTDKRLYGLRCAAGRSGFAITHDGHMCPCFSLHETWTRPLETGFKAAWDQLNVLANSYPIPAECMECSYREVCIICPAMHANAPSAGHCDPRICERTRKMIKEGLVSFPQKQEE